MIAETEYEKKLIEQFTAEAADASKSNEDRAYAQEQVEQSVAHVNENTDR